ncbi:efflux transporter outer membrane subunit [Xanthomonas sp. CFBP 8703]|uniref:Efflux transporter outer membrane subunit n=1 Tax=Xanthomonas bonasiae TaxID=2810351 RepID=A0ABS3B8M8_9XANT|nr:efflux transporter outer membrane subunit [Xanthomonas bonasiae]MBN6104685.1 efflux transporter outer membrane subunit [Xanthomonas bonasiae]
MAQRFSRVLVPAALPLLLSACVLGPNYVKPPPVAEAAQAQPQLHRADAVAAAAGVVPAPPPQRWWEALQDPQLNALVEQALQNSPNLRAAQAKLRASRALVQQRHAEQLPSVGANAAYLNARAPDALVDGLGSVAAVSGQPLSIDPHAQLYSVGFDASWELDFFGRRRRASEGALADAQADEAELADTQVQLAAEVGQAYLGYRGTRERIAIAERNLDAARQTLQLTRQRRERGADADLQVERAQAQLQQQEAVLPDLQAQAKEALDQLALMIGREPGALDAALAADRPLPTLPAVVPVDDAGALIRRRPDVRRAERQLASSSAQIGQALSAYFPQVTLLGNIGMAATSPGDLGSDAINSVVAPFLRWSIFDFGATRAKVEQARAGNAARLAAYEGTVLAALQDANSALARFGAARQQALAAAKAEASADRSAALLQQRYAAGASSLIDALDVQRQQASAQDSAVQARTQVLLRYVALQKSLGLGWAPPPAQRPPAAQ